LLEAARTALLCAGAVTALAARAVGLHFINAIQNGR
jgi:hypothetical protein